MQGVVVAVLGVHVWSIQLAVSRILIVLGVDVVGAEFGGEDGVDLNRSSRCWLIWFLLVLVPIPKIVDPDAC